MFTGIVELAADVVGVENRDFGRRLVVAHRWGDERHGDSVSVNGCCLTVAATTDAALCFDVVPETLRRTNLDSLRPGDRVHLERALAAGDRLDGHFVQGHVDGPAELVARETAGEWRLRIRPPASLAKYVLPKGSVAIDGVSLTVAAVVGDAFEVALIPTTLEKTTLGSRQAGWKFNFEADLLAKGVVDTVERTLQSLGIDPRRLPPGVPGDMIGK